MKSVSLKYSEKEVADMEKFKKKHRKCSGHQSGSFIYAYSDSNGIGCSYWIECEACGAKENVTDVESW